MAFYAVTDGTIRGLRVAGMQRVSRQRRTITPAQRGQVVQRVLVDGWTAGQAARAAGLDERLVVSWVAAYRRDGMASLNRDPGNAALIALWRPFSGFWRGLAVLMRGPVPPASKTILAPLPRSRDDRRHGA